MLGNFSAGNTNPERCWWSFLVCNFFSSWLVDENLFPDQFAGPHRGSWCSWFFNLFVRGRGVMQTSPIQTKSARILPLQPSHGVGYGSFPPGHLLCQKRKTLQSQKFFSSQDTMTLIQTIHFSWYNYHIIMELSLFAKHPLLLAIICTTAVPRGRDALHEIHEKTYLSEAHFHIQLQFGSARHAKTRREEQKALAQVWSQAWKDKGVAQDHRSWSTEEQELYMHFLSLWWAIHRIPCPPLLSFALWNNALLLPKHTAHWPVTLWGSTATQKCLDV